MMWISLTRGQPRRSLRSLDICSFASRTPCAMSCAACPALIPVPPLPRRVVAREKSAEASGRSVKRCPHAITAWRTVSTRSVPRSSPSPPRPATITAAGRGSCHGLSVFCFVFTKI